MTPQEGARKLRDKANALRRELTKSLTLSAKQGADIGRSLSTGPYTLKMLASMGHPYAVRHAQQAAIQGKTRRQYVVATWGMSSVAADYIINQQTGEFQKSWKAIRATAFRGGLRADIINDSRVAGFLAGRSRPQSRMIRRPVDDHVVRLLRPIMDANIQGAVRKAVLA